MSLGGGSKSQSTSDQRLNAIPISSSSYGNAVPLIYGQNRTPFMLLQYEGFTPTSHVAQQGGGKGTGGGSTSTTFTYTATVMLGIGEGQISAVGQVWKDKDVTTLAAQGLTLFTGAGGQATWSYATTNFPSRAVPYDHTAYVAQANMNLGSSAALPNFNFEITGLLPYNLGTINDAEPSAVLIDYSTDANHGCNFPYLNTAAIQSAGVLSYQSYCIAMGFFLSPFENKQRAAVDFYKEMLQITNSNVVNSAGSLNIVPYCDVSVTGNGRTYTPNLTPLFAFTDDDLRPPGSAAAAGADPIIIDRKPLDQTYNVVNVEYSNRAQGYNVAIAPESDDQDIAVNGVRVMPTITFRQITTAAVAHMVARLILQRQLYIRRQFTFAVRADYCLLEPMDLVSITDIGMGIINKLVRLIEVDDDENDNLTMVAEDMLVGSASAPAYNFQAAQGTNANWNVAPPSVATPLIFTIPPLLVDAVGGYQLGICVDQGAAGSWSGCDVYMSLDNASYIYAGTIAGGARYGTLTASLASHADPDTTNTLAIALTNAATTTKQILTGSAADYQNLRTLIYVDGEIMAYQTATLTSAGNYNLTSLRRGQYGSTPALHASSSAFARFDAAVFRVPFDPGMIGQTMYFKFCSFNVYQRATQSLAAATAYSHVLTANNIGQLMPGPLTLVGRGVTVAGNNVFKSGGVNAAWDSDVYSVQGYTNGAFVTWQPSQTNLAFFIGLGANPTLDSSYTSVNYGMQISEIGTIKIYESGAGLGTFGGAYAVGDIFSITYDGSFVRYLWNGALLHQTPAPPNLTLYLDSSFYHSQAAATHLQFGPYGTATPVLYIARGNCLVSDENVTKQGGSPAWDSDVYSISGYQTCHAVWKANGLTSELMVGLSQVIQATPNYLGLDFAIYCTSSGSLRIYESGTLVATLGTYTVTDLFAITYDGSTITYWWNGVSQRTVAIAGKTFFLTSSFYTAAGGINSLEFGPGALIPLADTAQINANAVAKVFTATVATSPNVTSATTTGTANQQIATLTVPALGFATNDVVTAQGFVNHNAGTGVQTSTVGDLSTSSFIGLAIPYGANTIARNPSTADQVSQTSFSLENKFSNPGTASVTYYFSASMLSSGAGASSVLSGVTFKVEQIIR